MEAAATGAAATTGEALPLPPLELMAGIFPVMTTSVRLSAPDAPDTSCSFAMLVTEELDNVPSPALVRLSMSIFVPAAGRVLVPVRPSNPNAPGVN